MTTMVAAYQSLRGMPRSGAGIRSRGRPKPSNAAMPNAVPALIVHCCHDAIGRSACDSSVPNWRSSALAIDPINSATRLLERTVARW